MGSFYVNITARTSAKEAVNFLENRKLNAYVMPSNESECVIFEEVCDTQDVEYLYKLLTELTLAKSCSALGVLNHDDDLLFLMLCSNGELKGDYTCGIDFDDLDPFEENLSFEDDESADSDDLIDDSRPPLTDEEKEKAKSMAQALSEAFNVSDIDAIYNTLTADFDLAGMEAHEQLVEVLGLSEAAIGYGYNYITQEYEEMDENFDSSKLIETTG